MSINSLGYISLEVRKLGDWLELLTSVFGLEILPHPNSEVVDLRMDEHHHRLTLSPSDIDRVSAVGWQVNSMGELETLAEALKGCGIEVHAGSKKMCEERRVASLYYFSDPMTQAKTEIFYGPLIANTVFSPSRGISGYNTEELGLGHIVFWVEDLSRAVEFYTSVMGFKISDYIAWDDNDAVFFHCNARHHSLALLAAAPGRPPGAVAHIMLEAKSLDDVGYGYDIARDRKIPIMMEPGKHTNDHMQSFYLQTPSGFWMEYGFGARLIGENWLVKRYDQPMLWGHRGGAMSAE